MRTTDNAVDFDRYWGVRLSGAQFDLNAMSIVLGLSWTTDSTPCTARLRFDGVSGFEFASEKIFASDVVELVSLAGASVDGGLRITGELSNYAFTIFCSSVAEE